MAFIYQDLDKWIYGNIDLAEEILETHKKAFILLSGASSSGKSYSASLLAMALKKNGHHPYVLSLDQYNVGLSHIIPRKVNQNVFHGSVSNIEEICDAIKPIMIEIPFSEKYSLESIQKLRPIVSQYLGGNECEIFLENLNKEWLRLNFDEPSVYDLKEAANDIKTLNQDGTIQEKKYSKVVSERVESNTILNGIDYDVILVEGIFALNETFLKELSSLKMIKNFVDGNPKSLFLRRIIRDKTKTSADSPFTVSIYFNYILKSYKEAILPTRESADVILNNDMTFDELRHGLNYRTKDEIDISKEDYEWMISNSTILEDEYQKDVFFNVENEKDNEGNLLRLRSISFDKGKTYKLSSLVHKGVKKLRLDHKIIRPINVLLEDGEVSLVFKDEEEVIASFVSAGFVVGDIVKKRKTKVSIENRILTLRSIEDKRYHLEFSDNKAAIDVFEIQKKVKIR